MQKVDGDYAIWFNKRHHRVGHLFQGRFKGHLIDSDEYLLQVARYIVLNPVRAHMVESAVEWPWSSARAMEGVAIVPPWLTTRTILERFHPHDPSIAQNLYRAFVNDIGAAKSPWRHLVAQQYLGDADFVDRVLQRFDGQQRSNEPARPQRMRCATLVDVRRAVEAIAGQGPTKTGSPAVRIAYAALAHSEALAPFRDIGATLGIGKTAVRYLVRRAQELAKSDRAFADLLERMRLQIRNCTLHG